YTTQDKEEAEETFKQAGLDPRLVSKQWRRTSEKHGLVSVYRFSNSHSGPLDVDADWNFESFGDTNDVLGRVLSSGSEQFAGKNKPEQIANASKTGLEKNYEQDYEQGLLDAREEFAKDLLTLTFPQLLEKYKTV
ncbi:MAG: hypothetical protein V1870_01980, partial [Candidatus Aenigmatarchaeota archaeon]